MREYKRQDAASICRHSAVPARQRRYKGGMGKRQVVYVMQRASVVSSHAQPRSAAPPATTPMPGNAQQTSAPRRYLRRHAAGK